MTPLSDEREAEIRRELEPPEPNEARNWTRNPVADDLLEAFDAERETPRGTLIPGESLLSWECTTGDWKQKRLDIALAELDRVRGALGEAAEIVEHYADGKLDPLVALGQIGHKILAAAGADG